MLQLFSLQPFWCLHEIPWRHFFCKNKPYYCRTFLLTDRRHMDRKNTTQTSSKYLLKHVSMVFFKLFSWRRSLSVKSLNLRETFTSTGAILLHNWLLTLSAYHERNCDEITKKKVILKLILKSKYLQKSLLMTQLMMMRLNILNLNLEFFDSKCKLLVEVKYFVRKWRNFG